MRQRLLQDGPLHSCPTDDLLIDLPTACLAESIQLQGEVLVPGAAPSIAKLPGTPQKLEILVGFSREKRNQFFEHKDACKPPKNQESIRTGKTVRQNGRFVEPLIDVRVALAAPVARAMHLFRPHGIPMTQHLRDRLHSGASAILIL